MGFPEASRCTLAVFSGVVYEIQWIQFRKSDERSFLALARRLLAYRLVSARTVTDGMVHGRLVRVRAPLPALTNSDMAI